MARIKIIYGTTGGNTQLVCQAVSLGLVNQGHEVSLERCELTDPQTLTDTDLLILASPTYGHGQLEPHFKKDFWPQIQDLDLAGLPCAVIGLGDDKYDDDYNMESARILEEYCTSHGGKLLISALRINKSVVHQLESVVQKWTTSLISHIS